MALIEYKQADFSVRFNGATKELTATLQARASYGKRTVMKSMPLDEDDMKKIADLVGSIEAKYAAQAEELAMMAAYEALTVAKTYGEDIT